MIARPARMGIFALRVGAIIWPWVMLRVWCILVKQCCLLQIFRPFYLILLLGFLKHFLCILKHSLFSVNIALGFEQYYQQDKHDERYKPNEESKIRLKKKMKRFRQKKRVTMICEQSKPVLLFNCST